MVLTATEISISFRKTTSEISLDKMTYKAFKREVVAKTHFQLREVILEHSGAFFLFER